MASKSLPKISLVGAGNVGSALVKSLSARGYPISSIINRTGKSALALARSVKCKKVSTSLRDISPASEVIIISVDDDSLSEVSKELSQVKHLSFKKLFVIHTSGAYSSDLLRPVAAKGSLTASFHPIQTFPNNVRNVKLQGISIGIEGAPLAVARAEQLAEDLGAHTVIISKELKPLYHIACVFSSGYLIIILNAIQELARKLELNRSWTEVFGPLMTSSMENTIKASASDALTGPIVRGDFSTVTIHLQALSRYAPQFLSLYTIAGIESARIACGNGNLSKEQYQEIVSIFKSFVKSLPSKKGTS